MAIHFLFSILFVKQWITDSCEIYLFYRSLYAFFNILQWKIVSLFEQMTSWILFISLSTDNKQKTAKFYNYTNWLTRRKTIVWFNQNGFLERQEVVQVSMANQLGWNQHLVYKIHGIQEQDLNKIMFSFVILVKRFGMWTNLVEMIQRDKSKPRRLKRDTLLRTFSLWKSNAVILSFIYARKTKCMLRH